MMRATEVCQLHELWDVQFAHRSAAGLAALYEQEAVVLTPDGWIVRGRDKIEEFYREFLAAGIQLGDVRQRDPLVNDDLAITSMELSNGGVTCEVARRQADGTWLWAIDSPFFASK